MHDVYMNTRRGRMVRRKTEDHTGKFFCKHCQGSFKTQYGLTQHINRFHAGATASTSSSSSSSSQPFKYACSYCHWGTGVFQQLELHWTHVCTAKPIKTVNNPSFDPQLLTPPDAIPPEYLVNREEQLRYEFVAYWRKKAEVVDNLHHEEGNSWYYREDLLDILRLLSFAMKYNLSNKGVEEIVQMMKELGVGSDRIQALPATWRTMTKLAMEGFDTTEYRHLSFDVPPDLGLDITSIPFVLKKASSVIESLLLDSDDMQHGNFYFGDPKGEKPCLYCGNGL